MVPEPRLRTAWNWARTFLHKVGAIQNSERSMAHHLHRAGDDRDGRQEDCSAGPCNGPKIAERFRAIDPRTTGRGPAGSALAGWRSSRIWRRTRLSGWHSGSCASRGSSRWWSKASPEMEESTESECFASTCSRSRSSFSANDTRTA
jgi:hypothetical protein